MSERTEIQKLTQEPVMVRFGNQDYEIKPLPIKAAIPWVTKVVKILSASIGLTKLKADDTASLETAMQSVMVENPLKIVDLVFEYARDLKREEIETVASSAQLMTAFERCLEFEKPFLMGMKSLKVISV